MIEAVGIIELTSIGVGFTVQDAMLKAADVRLALARTLCSGKYIIAVTGRVADVTASVDRGLTAAPEGVIDHTVIPRIAPAVFKALGQGVELYVPGAGTGGEDVPKALGVVETYSGTSVLEAADAAVKAGQVMAQAEIEELVRALEQCASPRTCPHGRPTMIHLSVAQLASEFGR